MLLFLSGWKGVWLMMRAILILFIALGLAGCKSQTPTVDPFFGRTTVPPPGTGSISGRGADPYYQPAPSLQPPSLQVNTPYNTPYNPGRTSNSNTTAPLFSGSSWTNPFNGSTSTNPSKSGQYPGPASSALTGSPPVSTPGTSPYSLQPVPQNTPALNSPPAGYPYQAPSAQPASVPSTAPGSTLPGGNRYIPPGGSYNYRGASAELPNSQPTPPSPNRVATPFFAGGVPNRTTIPVADDRNRLLNNTAGNVAGINPINNSYQNVSNSQPAYSPTGIAGGANSIPVGQSPIVRTLQPQTRDNSYPQGNNYMFPASRQSTAPTPAQPQINSPQPTWRESSSDARIMDDNIEAVSNTEAKDAQ
jgi:hypothetical protein